ncbi:hypothetical protein SY27_00440 [Flavobacterium sp. 316]|uniref:DUF4369 domain-containing protein n=1 Tax=Flavobacterium sediminilitoris TaxID=2024526 RepID=A0ABY4HIL0_9FLAO|nr:MULTISPECIES: hypothetical protein [Flavobacterium]KIX22364.1 hypothetical protein SY27_00440 [Flavobacterium sp. 316]UOX32666.1 hypothetical protein LXD69_11490 [Flavobacterium sediminilitoris]
MKKNYLLFFTLFLIGCNLYSQEIILKRGKVLADSKSVFNFDKRKLGSEISLFKLDTTIEVIFIEINNNNTISFLNDDYIRIVFPKNEVTIESTLLINKNFKEIIELLFINKVIDLDGNIDPEHLASFSRSHNNRKV